MKIKFGNYDLSGFRVRDVKFCGEEALLVNPDNIKTKFTKNNKIFRSSIWSKQGELLSAGFKKFTNWGENPEHFPTPSKITSCDIIEKIDGSTVILDYCNNQYNIRTRGTSHVDHGSLNNTEDFHQIWILYPKLREFMEVNPHLSLLFEITTPNHVIVLRPSELDFKFIGAIDKADYSILPQKELDALGGALNLNRPKRYKFNTFLDLFDFCATNKSLEGFCVYHGQDEITKVKTEYYVYCHRIISGFRSRSNVIDFYMENGCKDYCSTIEDIGNLFDFEVQEFILPHLSKICDGMKEVNRIVEYMISWLKENLHRSRKEIALDIQQKWGSTNRSGMAFTLLDNDFILSRDQKKKLLFQVLK
jgi:hypothetical protein